MKIKLMSAYAFFISLFIITFLLFDLFVFNAFSYTDEILGVISFVGITLHYLINRQNVHPLKNQTNKILILLVIIIIIGLVGNMLHSDLGTSFLDDLLEGFVFAKQYLIFIFLMLSLNQKNSLQIYKFVNKLSQLMVLVLFIALLADRFVGLGLTSRKGEFSFLAGFGATVSVWTVLFVCIIVFGNTKHKAYYTVFGAIVILFSRSGVGLLGLALLAVTYVFFIKQKKFHWYYLLIIIPFVVALSYDEISRYLLDSTAPRALLLTYAFVTANRFFPIGAGFATYGSASAVSNYSRLYTEYGFNYRYGMSSSDAMFLMDSYYARIVGETGYLGLILFVLIVYIIIRKMIFTVNDKHMKYYTLMLMGFLLAAGLGFGTGSAWGCTVYIIIAVMIKSASAQEIIGVFQNERIDTSVSL